MSKLQYLASVLILFGVAVLAAAQIVPRLLPESMFWTEEQALEQSRAASRLHDATFKNALAKESADVSATDQIHAQQELDAAKERFAASSAALAKAQFWRSHVPRLLRWLGTGIAVVGILIYVAQKGAAP